MLTKSTWKPSNLGSDQRKASGERQHLHLNTGGDRNLAARAVGMDTAAFGLIPKEFVERTKPKIPQNRDVPSLCPPPDLLNVCALHQPHLRGCSECIHLNPQSCLQGHTGCRTPKIPIKDVFTHSQAGLQEGR